MLVGWSGARQNSGRKQNRSPGDVAMKKIAIIALIHIAFGLQINATQITIYNDGFATVKENRVFRKCG
jgi:hypothetical protein